MQTKSRANKQKQKNQKAQKKGNANPNPNANATSKASTIMENSKGIDRNAKAQKIEIIEMDKVTRVITTEQPEEMEMEQTMENISEVEGGDSFFDKNETEIQEQNMNKNINNNNNNVQSKKRTSQGIQDRRWEKEQLHEINLRVDNIFNVFGNKLAQKDGSLNKPLLEEMRIQQNKMLKELTEEFLAKEQKKSEELANAKTENTYLQDKCMDLNADLRNSQNTIEQLRANLAKAKKEKEDAIREKEKIAEDAQNTKDALETQLRFLQEEPKNIYDPLKYSPGDTRGELAKEFAAKLAEALQDRDDQHNKLKEQIEEAFQKKLEQTEKDYVGKIGELSALNEALKTDLENLQADVLKITQERDEARNELETKLPAFEMMENELRKQKEQANEEVKRTKEKLEQAQKEQRNTSDLYFDLERMNLHLRAEIEALKSKLDAFEEQHKIESPVRPTKRRRTDSSLMDPRVLQSVQGPIIEAHTSFPLDCVTRQYEGDWTGFELQNEWSRPIVLKGWFLTDANGSSRLELPEKKLDAKEIIRVCLTGNKKEPSDLVWTTLELKKGERQELWAEDNLGYRHKIADFPTPTSTGAFSTESCLVM